MVARKGETRPARLVMLEFHDDCLDDRRRQVLDVDVLREEHDQVAEVADLLLWRR